MKVSWSSLRRDRGRTSPPVYTDGALIRPGKNSTEKITMAVLCGSASAPRMVESRLSQFIIRRHGKMIPSFLSMWLQQFGRLERRQRDPYRVSDHNWTKDSFDNCARGCRGPGERLDIAD